MEVVCECSDDEHNNAWTEVIDSVEDIRRYNIEVAASDLIDDKSSNKQSKTGKKVITDERDIWIGFVSQQIGRNYGGQDEGSDRICQRCDRCWFGGLLLISNKAIAGYLVDNLRRLQYKIEGYGKLASVSKNST